MPTFDLAPYLRTVSEYAHELHGDDPGAVERLAVAAGHGEVIYLTRAGEPVAAIVPAALAAADETMDAVEAGEPTIPASKLWTELGFDDAGRGPPPIDSMANVGATDGENETVDGLLLRPCPDAHRVEARLLAAGVQLADEQIVMTVHRHAGRVRVTTDLPRTAVLPRRCWCPSRRTPTRSTPPTTARRPPARGPRSGTAYPG